MNKFIEFNGIPGSGKTTIANRLLKDNKNLLKYDDIKKQINKGSKFKIAYIILRYGNIEFLWLIILFILRSKNTIIRYFKRAITLYNTFCIYNSIENICSNEVIIIDQGLIQYIISIPYDEVEIDYIYLKKMIKYISNKYNNIAFINCDLNNDELLRRLINRSNKTDLKYIIKDRNNTTTIIKNQKQILKYTRNFIQSTGFENFLNINTITNPGKNSKMIYDKFMINLFNFMVYLEL